jgi:hypothetical protein
LLTSFIQIANADVIELISTIPGDALYNPPFFSIPYARAACKTISGAMYMLLSNKLPRFDSTEISSNCHENVGSFSYLGKAWRTTRGE